MHDHIVIVIDPTKVREDDPKLSRAATQGCLYCANCGQHYNVEYPISFNMIDGISRGFRKDHRRCKSTTKRIRGTTQRLIDGC